MDQPVVYDSDPQKGIQASPGGRFGHAMVINSETETLVVFGGNGVNEQVFAGSDINNILVHIY